MACLRASDIPVAVDSISFPSRRYSSVVWIQSEHSTSAMLALSCYLFPCFRTAVVRFSYLNLQPVNNLFSCWFNHKEQGCLKPKALKQSRRSAFCCFWFWQLFHTVALWDSAVSIRSILQNLSRSSRSTGYFSPTVLWILRIQIYFSFGVLPTFSLTV